MNHDPIPKAPGVYQVKNIKNGYSYIGSAANLRKRCLQHVWDLNNRKHCNPYLQKVWNKHGSDIFEFYVLEELNDRDLLLAREQFFLDALIPEYNVCPIAGSAKGRIPTPEHREKLRQAGLGKKYPPERIEACRQGMNRMYKERPDVIERIRKSLTGKKQSEATKKKHSETMKRLRREQPERWANPMLSHTPEAKRKRSASLRKSWKKRKQAALAKQIDLFV